MRGLDFSAAVLDAVDLIEAGVEEGTFVGLDDTVQRFRDLFDFPTLFRHWNLGRYRVEGQPAILQEAWQRAQEEIASCDFALPADQEREVERLHAEAVEYLRGG